MKHDYLFTLVFVLVPVLVLPTQSAAAQSVTGDVRAITDISERLRDDNLVQVKDRLQNLRSMTLEPKTNQIEISVRHSPGNLHSKLNGVSHLPNGLTCQSVREAFRRTQSLMKSLGEWVRYLDYLLGLRNPCQAKLDNAFQQVERIIEMLQTSYPSEWDESIYETTFYWVVNLPGNRTKIGAYEAWRTSWRVDAAIVKEIYLPYGDVHLPLDEYLTFVESNERDIKFGVNLSITQLCLDRYSPQVSGQIFTTSTYSHTFPSEVHSAGGVQETHEKAFPFELELHVQ